MDNTGMIQGFRSTRSILVSKTMVLVRIGIAAALAGVSTRKLRRWDKVGKLPAVRTAGNHRRFSTADIQATVRGTGNAGHVKPGRVAVYCRVSSHEQKAKGDLDRQVALAEEQCAARGLEVPAVFKDVGSGLSGRRAGLLRLCKAIERGDVATVVVTFRDRLTRFGFDYLQRYFASHGASIVVTRQAPTRTMQEELVEDLVAIVTSFSGRVHGMRGRRGKAKAPAVDREYARAVAKASSKAWEAAVRVARAST